MNMSDFLTAKQVINLLKIDRTTLYRMLKEERINGVKIGSHWRFSRSEIDRLIKPDQEDAKQKIEVSADALPMHCIKPIQDVFSDIAQVAVVTTDVEGVPLSGLSNSCGFCEMILATEKGKQACIDSWKSTDVKRNSTSRFHVCHAGLHYAGTSVSVEGKKIAMLIAGQFHADEASRLGETAVKRIAQEFDLEFETLWKESRRITVLDERTKQSIGKWTASVARSFETIARERNELVGRLKNIAEISNL